MDIPQVLAVLRPNEDWGPCAQSDSTYEQLAAKWRGTNPVPTLEEMEAEWATIEAERSTKELQALRTAAIHSLLTATDPISVALRAFIRDLYTQINNLLELLGRDRVLEQVIVGRVIAGIGDGLGEPPQ